MKTGGMPRLVRAETRRLLTTALWKWALLAALLCGGGLTALTALVGPENFDPPLPGLGTDEGLRTVLALPALTVIVPALFGAMAMTSEYRHSTITSTFLFAPRRHTVLTAKLLVHAAAGLVYGLVVAASAAIGLYAALAVRGVGADAGTVAGLLLRVVAAMAVYTLLGVGVGALIRNQTTTLIALGLYLYSIEYALALIPGVGRVYPYLPGGATAALTDFTLIREAAAEASLPMAAPLSPVAGAAVLAAYALMAGALAVALPLRRDVT
ncbi:ABC transporter permease [Streptomyces sp. NPDC058001]|uniref:ABC transporter permease n=1 Tax=Streptomyces sp. NPDC058001 TaxID=3346300 RepID=UPI0036E7719B